MSPLRFKRFCFLALCSGLFLGGASVLPDEKSHAQVTLVSEVASLRPGTSFWVAIIMKMDPGWHTYWKNPGDSGLPARLRWNLPEGISAGPVAWPYPEKIANGSLVTFGYKDQVVLLVRLETSPRLPEGNARVSLRLDWLECADICLPAHTDLQLTLPVRHAPPRIDQDRSALFSAARFRLPLESSDWGVRAERDHKTVRLRLTPPADASLLPDRIDFFPDEPTLIERIDTGHLRRRTGGYVLEYDLSTLSGEKPANLRGVLVASGGWRGPDSEPALLVDVPLVPVSESSDGLGLAVLFSFLGGLLLNLMPCVLPVLSLKILGFVKHAHGERGVIRRHGLVFTGGVILSFWVLAGLLLLLRSGGEQLGWGFQLQSPVFVVCLTLLFLLLGLNMMGVFEVGVSWAGASSLAAVHSGYTGTFLNGILATVVATPCTAPFMGSALGFALAQPVGVAMMVFTSLALGLSFPYLLLSFNPALLRYVPKPGRWMLILKQVMGIFLLLTSLWLLWVMKQQVAGGVLLRFMLSLILVGGAAWIFGRGTGFDRSESTRRLASGTAILLIAVGLAWGIHLVKKPVEKTVAPGSSEGLAWEPFSEQRLDGLRQQGLPVFVDFTAAWCLTCQVNERTTLRSERVIRLFKERGIHALKADWTTRDDSITRALQRYDRSGVPLYVYYAPGPHREPLLLPAMITPSTLIDAIQMEGSPREVSP
ncbi:MAG TPA: protein-disulfide reductase DsbD family protein [Elusimicrobiota bacterium]|nr:protein-disulfide reductase DsbD family protein [Elusimicrobiota bacterium]